MLIALCRSSDDLEGVNELPCPFVPPPPFARKVHFWRLRRVFGPPTPLKGKDASSEQSVEGPVPKAQPSMANLATGEDTHSKVRIRGE